MQGIEAAFDLTLRIFYCPVVDVSQSWLGNVVIAKVNYLHINKQLCTSVNIPEALAASIDHQSKQSALSNHAFRGQCHKVADLCLQEALEGII